MGEIVSNFTYSHEIFGEGFYMVDVKVQRLSESFDIIPVMVSERLIDVHGDYKGMMICVNGQFRSYNRHEERRNRLVLSVFGRKRQVQYDFLRRLYLQGADLQKDPSWKRNRRSFACGEQTLWQIRLHTLHLLGQKCQICKHL